jgi:hypothetical protein
MKTLLLTIAGTLVLMLLLVTLKFLLEDRLAPTDGGIHGVLQQQRVDLLLVGSSHTRQGYDAKLLESLTGASAFIVAYNGLDPVGMLPLVRAILANPQHHPKLLVIEANCVHLAHLPDVEDPRLFFDSPPAVKAQLIAAYLRTHHYDRESYFDVFSLAVNRGNDAIATWPFLHWIMSNLSYHGGYLGKNMPGLDRVAFNQLHIPIDAGRPNPEQLAALHMIIALAKMNHVPLVLADTPAPAPVEAQPVMAAMRQEWQRLAAVEAVPYASGIDGFSNTDPALFNDSNHLSTAGRTLYTRLFAASLPALQGIKKKTDDRPTASLF